MEIFLTILVLAAMALAVFMFFEYKKAQDSSQKYQDFFKKEVFRNQEDIAKIVSLEKELTALKAQIKDAKPSIEAAQMLHDMTVHGNAVVKIVPLDPSQIFYRSPKG